MADTTQTSRGATEPAETEPEAVAEAEAPGEDESSDAKPDGEAPDDGAKADEDASDEKLDAGKTDSEKPDDEESGEDAKPDDDADPADPADTEDIGETADPNELPYPTRVGWVVAAFLFFWPLAIPALVQSMRTVEANGTGNVRRAKKSSVRTLDFSLGAVTVGVLGIAGLWIAIAAAPTYASALPPGFVAAAREFVPPALAGPLGIGQPDDGPALTEPTPSPTPTDDPYATADPYAEDPYADPYAEDPDALPTPEAGGQLEPTEAPTPDADTEATAGAEIPDLQVGDCIDTSATSGQTTLYRIPVVPCTTAHGGEIYAETTAADSLAENGATPTQQALWDAADAYCYPEFTKYVGLRWAKSELLYWPIAPSEESWAEGDRRILCVVESEQPVTGSLEGADR
ncbi:septum formation family protein [Promicromonospora sp. NPDC060204]|uniref:septum formation family protein n=1 Tax=Promicromonospora sp. NPDC060204 TaxID=3347071 RepID=UPI003658EDC3